MWRRPEEGTKLTASQSVGGGCETGTRDRHGYRVRAGPSGGTGLPRWEDAPCPLREPPSSEQTRQGRAVARARTHHSPGVVSCLFCFSPFPVMRPGSFFFFFNPVSLFSNPHPPNLSHGRDRIKTEKWRRSRCGEHVVSLLRH